MHETLPDLHHNQPVYSVSEVSQAVKRTVEDRFGVVRVRGEISGYRGPHGSGHCYFRLKDDKTVLEAVCFKNVFSRLPVRLEEGMEVVAQGRITTYPGKSNYQIVIESVEPAGVGALLAQLEKRRKLFESEGLFHPDRKRPLPYLPRVVGVVTSPTGAVIRDILHRIGERFPCHVLVWPVAVQGEGAAAQVAAAIEGFNAMRGALAPEVLIVARGGGSIEDLWAFNEEVVVRAAFACCIPLISAVGHETDTTLLDYVADRRAPTPTAAAEMAVPVREELWLVCKQLDARLNAASQRLFTQRQEQLEGLSRGLPRPMQLLEAAIQRLDDWSERLHGALPASLARHEQQLSAIAGRLRPQALLADMDKAQARLMELQERLHAAWLRLSGQREERLHALAALLESVNYHKVLERGFALVRDAQGGLVTSAKQAQSQDELAIIFRDGEVKVTLNKL